MSFQPSSAQLGGLSYQKAELYGKPHVNAHYEGKHVKSHKRDEDAPCLVCRKMARSVHHVPPLSVGHKFVLRTPLGEFHLKPSLFALCGSGTTGCHNDFHGGARFEPEWVWNSDKDAEAWWSGEILSRIKPHSPMLYAFGFWRIHDRDTGKYFEVHGNE